MSSNNTPSSSVKKWMYRICCRSGIDRNSHPTLESSSLTFQWSYKPLGWMIQILTGVQLSSNSIQWIMLIYGCLMIVSNIGANVFWWIDMMDDLNNMTSTDLLRETVEYVTSTVYYLGVPSIFFITSLTQCWKDLWIDLELIQREFSLGVSFFRQCRKWVFSGLLILGLV